MIMLGSAIVTIIPKSRLVPGYHALMHAVNQVYLGSFE